METKDTILPTLKKRVMEGHEERNRGSSNIPLTQEGRQEMEKAGKLYAEKGKVNDIYSSDLGRSIESSLILVKHTGAPLHVSDKYQPWHLGGLEGQKTKDVLPLMLSYWHEKFNVAPTGMGPLSTRPGESAKTYSRRFLLAIQPILDKVKEGKIIILVNHFRGIKLLQAWIKKGAPLSLDFDHAELLRHDGDPGDAHRFYFDSGQLK